MAVPLETGEASVFAPTFCFDENSQGFDIQPLKRQTSIVGIKPYLIAYSIILRPA